MQDLTFNLKPSRTLIAFMGLILGFSIIIILFVPLNVFLKIIGLVCVASFGSMLIFRYGSLRGRYSILGFRCLSDGHLILHFRNHSSLARLYGDSTVTPYISILSFQLIGNLSFQSSCIVLPDSLPKEDYRRLLSVIKTGRLQLVS
jgi:hypothetical protein